MLNDLQENILASIYFSLTPSFPMSINDHTLAYRKLQYYGLIVKTDALIIETKMLYTIKGQWYIFHHPEVIRKHEWWA